MAHDNTSTLEIKIILSPRARELQGAVIALSEELVKAPESELSQAAKRLLSSVENNMSLLLST